jgi:hypothetical protein
MKSFTTAILCLLSCVAFSQQFSKKTTFIITANSAAPLVYNRFTAVDMNSGKATDNLFDASIKKYNSRNNGYNAYQPCERRDDDEASKSPLGGSVASLAFDAKNNRLFYIPLETSELRYMDLKESNPSFTCLSNQSLNLLHGKNDVANQVTRMAIGADGFGYALSNDGEHLIKFTTSGTPVIQDMGVLIDNPNNSIFVRSSCTSWGGDMVAGADGNLYLIALHNHVFKISLPSKKCDYVGTIKNLPEEFTSNGASVDDKGDLLISCGTTYGKNFSPVYKVKWSTLEAAPVDMKITNLGNISDMASSNLLFQDEKEKKAVNNTVAFTQTVEKDASNETTIQIFPNPVNNGRFQIRTTNLKEKGDYRMILLDVNGKSVMESKMNLNSKVNTNSFSFPSRYAKGVYFVQISDIFNRTIYSQQLIVE